MKIGFDNQKYIELQSENIRKRINQFGGKLYLEFGGKLRDDYHASRVLPGFEPDVKVRMLQSLKDEAEIVIVVSADAIEKSKVRGDYGITYDEDVLRLMDEFESLDLFVGSVVITQYAGQPKADAFRRRLSALGVRSYRHYFIEGYPNDMARIVSDEGYGKNDFIETSRPLVVVTAPGPGSGKMATCLSQLYHEHKRGNVAGYAKWETFPVWNLPLSHPVNIAYEAATADLDDKNMIDHFHLEAYGKTTVNYNRDIEIFPVLREMMNHIVKECPYKSPTDMGVNMVGFAICDDEACREASRMEIFRRFFAAAVEAKKTGGSTDIVERLENIMASAGVTLDLSRGRMAALVKEEATGKPAAAITLPDGRIATGKTSDLMGCASSALMNALKELAGIPDEDYILTDQALEPICALKLQKLGSKNPRLHSDETLIALSISSATNERAAKAIEKLSELNGCDAFFSVIPASNDEKLYKKLGINLCCEPKYEKHSFFHQ